MKIENIKKVAVVGAGAMGSQITQIFAQVGGYPVTVVDIKKEFVDKGIQSIKDGLKKFFVDKGRMTEAEMNQITGRIRGTISIAEAAKDADFVVEAALENMDLKKGIFKQLSENAPPSTILASNTSYLNISEIASATNRVSQVSGMHFFNPIAVMKLVEVVRGPNTSDETVDLVVALAKRLGKEPIVCKDFSFGFLANRLYAPMFTEAIEMLWERVASPEDIDRAGKLGYNLPMGPLELGDYTGVWALWASSEQDKMKEVGPEAGHLHPLIRMMVRAGYPGGRGKKGVYDFYREVLSKS